MKNNRLFVENFFSKYKIFYPENYWDKLILYQELLLEENKITQLVSRNDVDQLFERHVLESLAIVSAFDFNSVDNICDLGSGGGLPGVPLAILFPGKSVFLIESKRKKTLFLSKVVSKLGLEKANVVCDRAEDVELSIAGEAVITARAVSSLVNLRKWSTQLIRAGCSKILAMKGGDTVDEIAELRRKYSRTKITKKQYDVDMVAAEKERYLLILENL